MSDLGLLEMLFMHVIVGIAVAAILFSLVLIVTITYLLVVDQFRKIARLIKEFFFPTPRLPQKVIEKILEEAAELVWSKHRPLDEDLFREYIWVSEEMLSSEWEKTYGKKRF